jgi:phenylpyruvate tautomerase PptA (4-oxalocrotonate tautomerase family)
MPIVDVEVVCAAHEAAHLPPASGLASVLGRVIGTEPGHTWVRFRTLDSSCYAENDAPPPESLPVFVTILHAHPPTGASLEAEVLAVTRAVAGAMGRPVELVHVQYAPAAAGRQAFGGRIVL